MYLRDIEIRIEREDFDEMGIKNTDSIVSLFLNKIKGKAYSESIAKINIFLIKGDGNKIIRDSTDVLDCYSFANLEAFKSLNDEYEKKKFILDYLLKSLLDCVKFNNWNPNPFLDAYNACLECEIKNEWLFKNKHIASSDKNFYVGAKNVYDLDSYRVYLILTNKAKKELGTSLIFKDNYLSFELDWIKWNEGGDSVLYKFKPPQKIFQFKMEDILKNVDLVMPEKFASFFK